MAVSALITGCNVRLVPHPALLVTSEIALACSYGRLLGASQWIFVGGFMRENESVGVSVEMCVCVCVHLCCRPSCKEPPVKILSLGLGGARGVTWLAPGLYCLGHYAMEF